MFTGIIRHVGEVLTIQSSPSGKRLGIDLGPLAESLSLGDSVAVNGACLTAAAIDASVADFDVVTETLERTTTGELKVGSKVNLETALALGGTLDGHLVQGHIDGIAEVSLVDKGPGGSGGGGTIEFSAAKDITHLMVPKGSVTVDGVSLTLAGLSEGGFSVAVIPTTLAETTLSDLTAGAKVNIETDVIGKYVRRYLDQLKNEGGGKLTLDKLREAGFA